MRSPHLTANSISLAHAQNYGSKASFQKCWQFSSWLPWECLTSLVFRIPCFLSSTNRNLLLSMAQTLDNPYLGCAHETSRGISFPSFNSLFFHIFWRPKLELCTRLKQLKPQQFIETTFRCRINILRSKTILSVVHPASRLARSKFLTSAGSLKCVRLRIS